MIYIFFFHFSLFVSVYVYASVCDFVCTALLLPFVLGFSLSVFVLFCFVYLKYFFFIYIYIYFLKVELRIVEDRSCNFILFYFILFF